MRYLILTAFVLLNFSLHAKPSSDFFYTSYKAIADITCIGPGFLQVSNINDFETADGNFYLLDNDKNSLFCYNTVKSKILYVKKLSRNDYIRIFKNPYSTDEILLFTRSGLFYSFDINSMETREFDAGFAINSVNLFDDRIYVFRQDGVTFQMSPELTLTAVAKSSKMFTLSHVFTIGNLSFYIDTQSDVSEFRVLDQEKTWWKTFRSYRSFDRNSLLKNDMLIRKLRSTFRIMKISEEIKKSLLLSYLTETKDEEKLIEYYTMNHLAVPLNVKEMIIRSDSSMNTLGLYDKYEIDNSFTRQKKEFNYMDTHSFETYSKAASLILLVSVFLLFMIKPWISKK